MVEKLYTLEEAAEVLRLQPVTVGGLLRKGKLQGLRTEAVGSGRWRTTDKYLQDYIDARKPRGLQTEKTEGILTAARGQLAEGEKEK